MSFGISATDILKLIEGCVWLVNRFDKDNSADEQLKHFIRDVKLLEKRLRRLAQALEDALDRYEHPEIDAQELRCDLQDLVGDAGQTIDEARDLARNHIKIQENAAGFIHNVIWAAHAEPKAQNLRKAMQFHAQKIFLVIEPVNLRLLTTIDGKIDEMVAKLDQLLERSGVVPYSLPTLPGWLDTQFREALFTNQPTPFEQSSSIPLREGFDALYLHYRESTYAFRDTETAEQTGEQYLNLLKCQWLLSVLRSGDQFRRAGSLYPRLVKQVEQRIIKEYQRMDIIHFQDAELKKLSPTAFLIWPPQQVVEVRNATDPNLDEHVLLRLTIPTPLAGEKDSLVIFRTGPSTLRIAKRSSDRAGTSYYVNEHYNIHQDAFVPYYAIAEDPPTPRRHSIAPLPQSLSFNISIYRGNATGAIDYRLNSDADLYNFQRAVTGYQVVFDQKVTWAIKQSGVRGQLSCGQGRMQIWHWKPLEELANASEQVTSPNLSARSPRSNVSVTSDAVVEKLVQRRNTSMFTVDARSTAAPVISATTPPHPVIVIYGKSNEVYTYYHIELDFDIQIVPSACPCDAESKKAPQDRRCVRSVIEKRNRKGSRLPFTTRTLTATKNNLSQWNLGVFAQPRHPMFHSKKIVQSLGTDFLNIDFASVLHRMEFGRKFEKALQLRNMAEAEYRRIVEATRFLGERNGQAPPRPLPPPPPRGSYRADSVSSFSSPSIPDGPPEARPLFPVSMFRLKDSGAQDNVNAHEKIDVQGYSRSGSHANSRTSNAFRRWARLLPPQSVTIEVPPKPNNFSLRENLSRRRSQGSSTGEISSVRATVPLQSGDTCEDGSSVARKLSTQSDEPSVTSSDNSFLEKTSVRLKQDKDNLFELDRQTAEPDFVTQPAPMEHTEQYFHGNSNIETASGADEDSGKDNEGNSNESEVENQKDNTLPKLGASAEFLTSGVSFDPYEEHSRKSLHPVLEETKLEEEVQSDILQESPTQLLSNQSEHEHINVTGYHEVKVEAKELTKPTSDGGEPTEQSNGVQLQTSRSEQKGDVTFRFENLEPSFSFPLSLPLLVDTILQRLPLPDSEPPVPEGKTRARWKCRGGVRQFDDFTELDPGAVKELEMELEKRYRSSAMARDSWKTTFDGFNSLWRLYKRSAQKQQSSNPVLPLDEHKPPSDQFATIDITQQPGQTNTGSGEPLRLLLCMDEGDSKTLLQQADLNHVSEDRELFLFLRSRYFARRKWFTVRSVKSLSLSQFQLNYSNTTDVHKHEKVCISMSRQQSQSLEHFCICLPPEDRVGEDREYLCHPAPKIKTRRRLVPVLSSKMLKGDFLDPYGIETGQKTTFNQLPKRLGHHGHLKASPVEMEIGWGIHFEEDWHWPTIYFVFVVLVLFSLIFGVVWSVCKHDIQGGFAVSGFSLTLGSLLLGYLVLGVT